MVKTIISVLLPVFLLSSCGADTTNSSKQSNSVGSKSVDTARLSKATFAAGCFWHEETLFESIKGVNEVISGYCGGTKANPTYEDVETGSTGHAEAVNVYYDSSVITYPTLLKIFIEGQDDPTQVDGQGPDLGSQYRSAVFYRNDMEKKLAEDYLASLNVSGKYSKLIAAEVTRLDGFWIAEQYHQNYIAHNSNNPYVQHVSIPEIARFQALYPELIKSGHSFLTESRIKK